MAWQPAELEVAAGRALRELLAQHMKASENTAEYCVIMRDSKYWDGSEWGTSLIEAVWYVTADDAIEEARDCAKFCSISPDFELVKVSVTAALTDPPAHH